MAHGGGVDGDGEKGRDGDDDGDEDGNGDDVANYTYAPQLAASVPIGTGGRA